MSEAGFREITKADRDLLLEGACQLPTALAQMGFTELRKGQEDPIMTILAGRDTLCILPTGCHAKGTGIMMYDGRVKLVEDVKVGDILMGPDSLQRTVLQLCQGKGPMRRVIPVKGEPFVCNDAHILSLVRTNDGTRHSGEVENVEIRDWEKWNVTNKHLHKLYRVGVTFRGCYGLPLDPYFVGLWLGDGRSLVKESSLEVYTPEAEVELYLDHVTRVYGLSLKQIVRDQKLVGYRLSGIRGKTNPVSCLLRSIGLDGCGVSTKFIPHKYKTSSREDRLMLLAGLIDSDGSLTCEGFDYISKSEALAGDVAFIARSLGLAAYVNPCTKSCQTGASGRYHRVSISGDCSVIPVQIPRKKASKRRQKKDVLRTGFKVETLPEDNYYGFTLDGDSLYLMSDFTVTHNTGKSAVFTIPSLCHNWPTVVLSPLVALMRDQVKGLWNKGIAGGALSGMQTPAENASTLKAWMDGEVQFLYVAPERLDNEQFRMAMKVRPPFHVVVDEAHTITQWSDNFRPAYIKAGSFVAEHNPRVVSAFTATCPAEVEADIRRVLGIPNAKRCMYYPRRSNLKLSSAEYTGVPQIARMIEKTKGCGIVYCSSIKNVEETAVNLKNLLKDEEVAIFHAQLSPSIRRTNQDLFMEGKAKVVVATNAFGMGIDKPDIRFVIHRDIPGSIESLAQEVGRAGRDGKESWCCTLSSAQGRRIQEYFLDGNNPDRETVTKVYQTLKSRADGGGKVMLTIEDIGKMSGISSMYVGSSISALAGAGCIKRESTEDKLAMIKVLSPQDDDEDVKKALFTEDKFVNTCKMITEGGVETTGGFVEIDLNWICQQTGRTLATVMKWIRQWEKDGLLEYVPPFRGSVTFITGGLNLMDFDRLKNKAKDDYNKLNLVYKYLDTPDDNKHEFIERYFEINR